MSVRIRVILRTSEFRFDVVMADGTVNVLETRGANEDDAKRRIRAFVALNYPGARLKCDPPPKRAPREG